MFKNKKEIKDYLKSKDNENGYIIKMTYIWHTKHKELYILYNYKII